MTERHETTAQLIEAMGDIASRFDISRTEGERIAQYAIQASKKTTQEVIFGMVWMESDVWKDENNQ